MPHPHLPRVVEGVNATTPVVESALLVPGGGKWAAGALVLIVLVGVVDYLTGPEITFSVFYLVPVAVAAWCAGSAMAITASMLAAISWLVAEILSSRVPSATLVYAWNFSARLLFLLLVAVLLARLREMLVRERALGRTDVLTGLFNARAFREIAEAEVARASRYRYPLSLAFIDLDDFKTVNDARGHAAGDLLLREMGSVIRVNLRGSDVVARYGGDEFVILLPMTDEAAARTVLGKLHERLGDAMARQGWPVTVSVGVFTAHGGEPTVDFMLENADRLMYTVKSAHKDGIRFATASR